MLIRGASAPRESERGQTLPVWIVAIFTALTLMFFALNYANELHWQVRAQNAADSAASGALIFQSLEWNKMNVLLYSADVEEWRIHHLIQGMVDAANGNGGCTLGSSGTSGGTCFPIYQALRTQYLKAVSRYSTDIGMLQGQSAYTQANQAYDVAHLVNIYNRWAESGCPTSLPIDCTFTYHLVDYSSRTTSQQVGKDQSYLQAGGFSSPQNSTPNGVWEPARIEIATCATVAPVVKFSLFGYTPQSYTVIGRAAATNVPVTADWLSPGVTTNPASGSFFQSTEVYDSTDDTFASTASPRDWYETEYQAQKYAAHAGTSMPYSPLSNVWTDDFEVMLTWWASIPITPYTTTAQTQSGLCTPAW
jgi:hypothetical protein